MNTERTQTRPEEESTRVVRFRCSCGDLHDATTRYTEKADSGDGDSLDLRCRCGAYYKKVGKIPESSIVESWYERGWRN